SAAAPGCPAPGLPAPGRSPLPLADALQDRRQAPFGRSALTTRRVPAGEDIRRHFFHLPAGRFQLVREPTEERVHQPDENRQGVIRQIRLGGKVLGDADTLIWIYV